MGRISGCKRRLDNKLPICFPEWFLIPQIQMTLKSLLKNGHMDVNYTY